MSETGGIETQDAAGGGGKEGGRRPGHLAILIHPQAYSLK